MKKANSLTFGLLNTILNTIFPIITLPYVFNTLGADLYGENLLASLYCQFFSFLFIGAINSYAVRKLSLSNSNSEKESYYRLFSMQFILAAVAGFLHLAVLFTFGLWEKLYLFYAALTFLSFLNIEWYFQAKQKYAAIFFRTLFVKAAILIALILLVKDKDDFLIYVLLMVLSILSPWVISFYIATKTYGFKFIFSFIRVDILAAKHFFTNGAIGSMYRYLDQIFIGMLITPSELALVNLLKTLTSVAISIPSLVNRFLMPDAIRSEKIGLLLEHHKKYFPILIVSLLLGCSIFITSGDYFLNLIFNGTPYFEKKYVILVSLAVTFSSLAVYIDNQCSVVLKLEKITTYSNLTVASVFVLSIITLYPSFGFLSPIISLIISELVGVFVMIFMHLFIFKTYFHQVNKVV
jgi:O-antigen/teichoic acid export membrane protein